MQGMSLRKIWQNPGSEWRNAVYYHYYEKGFGATPHYGVRTDRYKLIRFYDIVDSWEFYDLESDPNEMQNLANDPQYEQKIEELKSQLNEMQKQYKDTIK